MGAPSEPDAPSKVICSRYDPSIMLMTSPPSLNANGLTSYWDFNEGSGTTLTDLSGNGNNGTINGANWELEENEEE